MINIKKYEDMSTTKIVIVGNGYDLAMGAKTSYENFYECLEKCFNSSSIDEFKNDYLYEDNERFIVSFYNVLNDNKDNFFINYFLKYKNVFGDWVSFEKELTIIIKSMDSLLEKLKSPEFIKSYYEFGRTVIDPFDNIDLFHVLTIYENNKYYCISFDYYVDKRVMYFDISNRKWTSEEEIYKAVQDFEEEFPYMLYQDLQVFSKLFSFYLGIVDHFVQIDSMLRDSFGSVYYINYNYTNYIEKIKESDFYDEKKVLYINGKIDFLNNANEEKIVFGIDSNVRLSNSAFRVFTKRIQRSLKDTDISILNEFIRNFFTDVVVVGHSLNAADYESLHYIFSICNESPRPNITIYYYNEKAKIELLTNLNNILGDENFDIYQKNGLIKLVDSKKAWE